MLNLIKYNYNDIITLNTKTLVLTGMMYKLSLTKYSFRLLFLNLNNILSTLSLND